MNNAHNSYLKFEKQILILFNFGCFKYVAETYVLVENYVAVTYVTIESYVSIASHV